MNALCEYFRSQFSTVLGSVCRVYFHGKVELPRVDDLPILMVYPNRTEVRRLGTVRDDVSYYITVEVQVSLRQYYDMANGQGTKLDSLDALEKIMEERETDGTPKTATVLGVINDYLTGGGNVLYNQNITINYDTFRVENTQRAKATLTFRADDRPNRT